MSTNDKWQLAGWTLFILCALLYTASALRSGDVFSITGSIVFLIACFVFLVPLFRKN